VSNRVHRPMQAVKLPPLHPAFNRAVAHSERDELSAPHDPMLPPRKLGDPPINRGLSGFPVHMTGKSDRSLDSPPRRGSGAAYVDSRADAAA
jgi:hypothetical protein